MVWRAVGVSFLLAVGLAHAADPPEARANDNRTPAGRLEAGVLTIALEIREAVWNPEGDGCPLLPIQAFAEQGHSPANPGPLIRAAAGTTIRVSIHNLLASQTAAVHGFRSHFHRTEQAISVPPLSTREVEFRPDRPGVYLYWATTTGATLDHRAAAESQLSGALVIDPPHHASAGDRVFVLGHWSVPGDPKAVPPIPDKDAHVINGKSWPHTERLEYTAGETVRWRWVNATDEVHPLHMHGHYFSVEAKGDQRQWAQVALAHRRLSVTETISSGSTMDISGCPSAPAIGCSTATSCSTSCRSCA